jgi:hypothetical protein
MSDDNCAQNTDVVLWREPHDDTPGTWDDKLFVTRQGGIGIDIAGIVIVRPLKEWHALAAKDLPKPEPR